MEPATIEFTIRIIARLGFMLVVYGAYRLWHMPVLKRHASQFFWLALVVCTLSLLYTVVEYFFLGLGNAILTITFNTIGTWVLAIFMNYRAYKINVALGTDKVRMYQTEINKQIEEIKRSAKSR